MPPPPKEFADLAEAKTATSVLLTTLKDNSAALLAAAAQGETQQQKIAKVMPLVQAALSTKMTEMGFPPGPMSLMIGLAALNKAKVFPGGEVIGEALDMLQGAMMKGETPSEEALSAMLEKLK